MRHSVNPNTPGTGSPKDMGSPKKLALILQLVLYIKHNHDINQNFSVSLSRRREIAKQVVLLVNGKAVNYACCIRRASARLFKSTQKVNIMEKYCISIDWLQTFCHAAPISEGNYSSRGYNFAVKKENHETAQFRDIFTVYYKSHPAATIQQTPRTSVINPRATCVKLSNRILYCGQYINILYAIQESLSMQYKGITRLDLCYDCNRLHDGRDTGRFIRQFVANEPMQPGHIIRNGSSRFTLHGTRTNSSIASLNSIRWGSSNAKIGAYCYDKTLELTEIKDKPWIRKMWEENGIEYDIDETRLSHLLPKERKNQTENNGLSEYVKKRVWRFEISIKCEGTDVLNMSTGELFRLSPLYLEHAPQVEKLFYIYAAKVFDFRINTGQKQIRNYKKLQLFESVPVITSKPFYCSTAADTGRMEKICYNKLQRLAREYTNLSEPRQLGLISAMEFLQELQGKKSQTLHAQRYTQYLNNLQGSKFINYEDVAYFGALETAAQARREINSDDLYNIIFEYPPIPQEELQYLFTPEPDYTPNEYTW